MALTALISAETGWALGEKGLHPFFHVIGAPGLLSLLVELLEDLWGQGWGGAHAEQLPLQQMDHQRGSGRDDVGHLLSPGPHGATVRP